MDMTASEIECAYRQSKKKAEQIGILADRNCCTKDEIIKVLIDTGKYKNVAISFTLLNTQRETATTRKSQMPKRKYLQKNRQPLT